MPVRITLFSAAPAVKQIKTPLKRAKRMKGQHGEQLFIVLPAQKIQYEQYGHSTTEKKEKEEKKTQQNLLRHINGSAYRFYDRRYDLRHDCA